MSSTIERAERAALYIFLAGVGVAMVAAAGPLAFPDLPKIIWQIVALVGVLLTLSSAAFLFYEYRDLLRTKRPKLRVGLLLLGIAFAGFIGWYFWHGKIESAAAPSSLDGTVQITFEHTRYPTFMPQNKVYELQLNDNFSTEIAAFLSFTLQPGDVSPYRNPALGPNFGAKFRIWNYGKTAAINAIFAFRIDYQAIEKIENGIKSGEIKKSGTVFTNPLSIGAGDFVEIYAMNFSTDAFASIVIPETAQGLALGADKPTSFKLIPALAPAVGVEPFVPKAPPTPPAQAPAPPNAQDGSPTHRP